MSDPQAYRRLFEDNADGVAVLEDLVKRFSQPQVSAGGIGAVLKTYERGSSSWPTSQRPSFGRASGVDFAYICFAVPIRRHGKAGHQASHRLLW